MSSVAGGLAVPGLGFDEHVAVNVRAPFFLIQAARPALRESPVRSVVNVSSSPGRIGAPEEVALWIALLLSPLASPMTGAVIPLDGGQVIDRG
jgi:NAD(P)-dependent dehydrogenase (short-subunit alcohol dehydrogenase family)